MVWWYNSLHTVSHNGFMRIWIRFVSLVSIIKFMVLIFIFLDSWLPTRNIISVWKIVMVNIILILHSTLILLYDFIRKNFSSVRTNRGLPKKIVKVVFYLPHSLKSTRAWLIKVANGNRNKKWFLLYTFICWRLGYSPLKWRRCTPLIEEYETGELLIWRKYSTYITIISSKCDVHTAKEKIHYSTSY